jgi:hypothetical protein
MIYLFFALLANGDTDVCPNCHRVYPCICP